jgi:hypothetical protein
MDNVHISNEVFVKSTVSIIVQKFENVSHIIDIDFRAVET